MISSLTTGSRVSALGSLKFQPEAWTNQTIGC
jgi:hypothetical protein